VQATSFKPQALSRELQTKKNNFDNNNEVTEQPAALNFVTQPLRLKTYTSATLTERYDKFSLFLQNMAQITNLRQRGRAFTLFPRYQYTKQLNEQTH
jgi:hypothetical protein